jgi:hypothetical protein
MARVDILICPACERELRHPDDVAQRYCGNCHIFIEHLPYVPGWEGSRGPTPSGYTSPHVYARDIHSGAGNCVCGLDLGARVHIQAAPGVPVPDRLRRT